MRKSTSTHFTQSICPPAVAAKILEVQASVCPLVPLGEMWLGGREPVKYLSKNQVLNYIRPMLADYKLTCLFAGIQNVELLDVREVLKGKPLNAYQERLERFWVKFTLVDNDSGEHYSQVVPADVMGTGATNPTVAMAYAERDFLINMFLLSADDGARSVEEASMSEYTAMDIALNAGMDVINESLRIKAIAAIKRVTKTKFNAASKKAGFAPSSLDPKEMNPAELLEAITIAVDIMNPADEKIHLEDVGGK